LLLVVSHGVTPSLANVWIFDAVKLHEFETLLQENLTLAAGSTARELPGPTNLTLCIVLEAVAPLADSSDVTVIVATMAIPAPEINPIRLVRRRISSALPVSERQPAS
jgi:hypothetical protein